MFFTIIIPAFNCQATIQRLLYSIRQQKIKDLEVIIADDSDKDHQDLYKYIEPYTKSLKIDYYKREDEPYEMHCPGNTRHSGLKRALEKDTEYIMFIDCDDQFKPNTFKTIKDTLIKADYPYILGSAFEVHDMDDKLIRMQDNNLGWLHGKCFKASFLRDHNIQFKPNMATHEDSYFLCELTYYLMQVEDPNKQIAFNDFSFYIWYERPDSTSHLELNRTGVNSYLQNHLNDYLMGSLDTYTFNVKRDNITNEKLLENYFSCCIKNLIMSYFYYQGFAYNCDKDKLPKNYSDILERVKNLTIVFNKTKEDIIENAYSNVKLYEYMRQLAFLNTNLFIEEQSFRDFISGMEI